LTNVYNSYDVVGDIAIIRLNEESTRFRVAIAEAVMSVHKNVKTVLAQIGAVDGDFRLRRLENIAGENKTMTVHKESGCLFSVDVEKCYFSPRLLSERMRIARQVDSGEVVVNMFAGVGCFSVVIARHANPEKVYSIDMNPVAFQYMRENVRMNGVYGKMVPLFGDAKEVIGTKLCHVAHRVLVPLPEKALEYLPYALLALKPSGGVIHYYDFEHAGRDEEPVEKVKVRVADKLRGMDVVFEFISGRVVRSTGPNWCQIALDLFVKSQV
jgi:tRNA (guanine37-N1)-methyltransferase